MYELIRTELIKFATEQERVLRKHDVRKSDSWKYMPIEELRSLLTKSYKDWLEAATSCDTGREMKEAIDIANLSMFIWNRDKEVQCG